MHLRFNAPVSVVEDDEIREAPCHMRHGAAARRHSAVAAAAAAVAQANPLRATHAAAHHKMLPPLHGGAARMRVPSQSPSPVHPKGSKCWRRETCAAVKACTALRCGATGCRGRSLPGGSPLQQLRGRPSVWREDSPPGWSHKSWAITKHTYSMSGRTQRGLTTGSCASERAALASAHWSGNAAMPPCPRAQTHPVGF
ncbi:hypothetical protein TcBrA4_0017910 [Trypanosoma cruzi]|nr:hypothetical protein TcBrA4_0017910 [Trypanosoma cruzi]